MKMKISFIIVSILFILLVLFNSLSYINNNKPIEELSQTNAVCGQNEGCEVQSNRVKGFNVGEQIPNLELIDFEGNKTYLYDMIKDKDEFVLSLAVDWCSDCQRQDDKLNEYYPNLESLNKGAAVVFVDYSSKDGTKTTNKEQAKEFTEKMNYSFPIFWDEGNDIANSFGGVKATPTNIVLDGNGIIKAKTEEIDMDILLLDNKENTYFDTEE